MTEEKKKISKLCVTGFILSVMPLVIIGIFVCLLFLMDKTKNTDDSFYYIVLSSTLFALPLITFVLSSTGLGLSIAGLITAKRKNQKGKGLGIAGIAFPVLYLVTVIVLIVLAVNGIIDNTKKKKQDYIDSDIYKMGTVWNYENTEYDVSEYRIYEGYELDSSDVTSSASELRQYANSKLDSIDYFSSVYVKGRYQGATFLIIRRDRYDSWDKDEPIGYVSYHPNDYAQINYEYQWEFSGFAGYILDMYKDPSDKYIIVTNCSDYKAITEFFEDT